MTQIKKWNITFTQVKKHTDDEPATTSKPYWSRYSEDAIAQWEDEYKFSDYNVELVNIEEEEPSDYSHASYEEEV